MTSTSNFEFPVYCADNGLPSQFQYVEQALTTVDGGLGAYLVQLGYLASIWEQVCSPVRSEIQVPFAFTQDYGEMDFLKDGDGKRCSAAQIDVISVPNSANMEFDPPEIIQVGKCGFFRGNQILSGDSTQPALTISGGIGWGARPAPGRNVPATAGGFPQFSQEVLPGIYYNYSNPPVVAAEPGGSVGGSVTVRLNGGTSSIQADNFNYPLKYINYRRSLFLADRPDATGFWWKLKPGVIANITVFGVEVKHAVGFNDHSGEGGQQAHFNPMTCGLTV